MYLVFYLAKKSPGVGAPNFRVFGILDFWALKQACRIASPTLEVVWVRMGSPAEHLNGLSTKKLDCKQNSS